MAAHFFEMQVSKKEIVMRPKSRREFILCVLVTVLLSLPVASAQEQVMIEVARGNWRVEYEGNVMEVRGIERVIEYQPYFENSTRARGPKMEAPPGSELAVLFLRTERVTAKSGFYSRNVILISVDGKTFEQGTVAIGGPGENRFDRAQHLYEIPIAVPKGTKFSQVVLYRQKYEPSRRESVVIDIPSGL